MKLDNIKLGKTIAKVMRKSEDNDSAKEIHRGIIVQDLNAFVRIFNFDHPDKGGDIDPLYSELFPVKSNRAWVEIVGELKEHQGVKVPVQFNV